MMIQQALNAAVEMHRAGQFEEAARLYQDVLSREHENAEALHMLGVLYHQRGDHARAIELIGRAVFLRPASHVYHANLAEAYRAHGDFELAANSCRLALAIWPDYPEALCNLGAALQGLGKCAEAVPPLRRALELRPTFVVAHNNLGISLRELGNVDGAYEQLRIAVDLEPSFAPARTNLGQLLVDRGDAAEALSHCLEAVRLQPETATLHHNLGNVYRVLERWPEARAAYLEALRLDPDTALTNAHLGLVLQRDGEPLNALPRLRRAVELAPENATYWEWLAGLHDDLDNDRESLACWERVVALAPANASARLSLGWSLQDDCRFDEARLQYEEALRIQPDSGAAHLNLGGLEEELGNMPAAEAEFREALRLQPNFALPHARLAVLLRADLPDDDLAALDRRLLDADLNPGPRARLLFALGQALDARGDYDRAAECAAQANALALEHLPPHRRYTPADHERFVGNMIDAFNPDFFAIKRRPAADGRRPVFIFGLPRSGTTLIEQVLASHPSIHGAGELRLGRRSFESIPAVLDRPGASVALVPALDDDALETLAARHRAELDRLDGGASACIVDKMPDNYMYLGLLALMFPQGVFIHARRDLRDIALSCWMTDFRSIRWANDQDHIAHRCGQYRRFVDHWRAVLPVPVHEVQYEETVSDLEAVARRLVDACGLDWDPACLDFHHNRRPIRTASVAQVRKPLYKSSVARWKRYESSLASLFGNIPTNTPCNASEEP